MVKKDKQVELTKQQMVAIIMNCHHELQTVFAEFPKIKKLADDERRRTRILEDLAYLITKGFKQDLGSSDFYSVFSSDLNI